MTGPEVLLFVAGLAVGFVQLVRFDVYPFDRIFVDRSRGPWPWSCLPESWRGYNDFVSSPRSPGPVPTVRPSADWPNVRRYVTDAEGRYLRGPRGPRPHPTCEPVHVPELADPVAWLCGSGCPR